MFSNWLKTHWQLVTWRLDWRTRAHSRQVKPTRGNWLGRAHSNQIADVGNTNTLAISSSVYCIPSKGMDVLISGPTGEALRLFMFACRKLSLKSWLSDFPPPPSLCTAQDPSIVELLFPEWRPNNLTDHRCSGDQERPGYHSRSCSDSCHARTPGPVRTLIGSSAHVVSLGDSQLCEIFCLIRLQEMDVDRPLLEMYHVKRLRATVTSLPERLPGNKHSSTFCMVLFFGAPQCYLCNESNDNLTTIILQQWHGLHHDWFTTLHTYHCSSHMMGGGMLYLRA